MHVKHVVGANELGGEVRAVRHDHVEPRFIYSKPGSKRVPDSFPRSGRDDLCTRVRGECARGRQGVGR